MVDYDQYEGSAKQVSWAASIMRDFAKHKLTPNKLSLDDLICLGLTDASMIIDNKESLSKGDSSVVTEDLAPQWLKSVNVDEYTTFLLEKSRSPSKGGNTSALHSHRLVIDDDEYFFKGRGAKKWIYKSDTCSFSYYVKGGRKQVIKGTIVTIDKAGNKIMRGDQRAKNVLRTASQRLPCSRREARD